MSLLEWKRRKIYMQEMKISFARRKNKFNKNKNKLRFKLTTKTTTRKTKVTIDDRGGGGVQKT